MKKSMVRPGLSLQCRLPKSVRLDDLVGKIGKAAQPLLREAGYPWKEGGEALTSFLKGLFDRHFISLSSCGSSGDCNHSLKPAAWNDRPLLWGTLQEPVKRYHLRLTPGGLDAFSVGTAKVILRRAGCRRESALGPASVGLRQVLQDVLGPHLFMNFCCGRLEICRNGRSLDPWSSHLPA